jgi:hypothetical protein
VDATEQTDVQRIRRRLKIMVLTNRTAEAGDFYHDALINQVQKSSVAIAKGDVIGLVTATDDFATAAANATARRFAVATEAAATGTTKVSAVTQGHVNVKADGAIGPGNRVKAAPTAGQVVEFIEGTDAYNSVVGTYVGHPASGNERDGVTQTAAADDEIIIIRVGL